MTRTDISPMPNFFDRYIKLVDEDAELLPTLAQTADFGQLLPGQTAQDLGDRVYAPGKWTIRDTLQHLIDTERIMAYRALRFARADDVSLPGFDEELFGQTARANQRLLADLYNEYAVQRQANIALFQSFSDEMLHRRGAGNYQTLSVLAIGFVLAGHVLHHVNIIRERYLSLINQ